ncbi:MAG: amidohydrolase family protein [Alphaproteobacteria bacterium]|nr:amidohydrolase family protein [Alphaproteobacteria bacterium]
MARILTGLAVILAALGALILALPEPDRPSVTRSGAGLAITNVTVFDGARFLDDQTILITGGRIGAVGPGLDIPAGAELINGAGLTALPGLIDAHTHTWGDGLEAALRFGVTAQLDMFSSPMMLPQAQRNRADLSVHDQADLFSSGMLATVEGGHGTQFGVPVETLSGPDQAADWVAARKAEGSDYIKLVYIPGSPNLPSLDLATATAVIEAAHAEGLMAVAHIATLDAAREMVDAGIDGLVHIFADEPADAAFITAAREAEVFVIPTLAVIASVAATGEGEALADDPRVRGRLSASALRGLEGGFGMPPSPRFQYPLAEANVRALHEGGVVILAGSDAPNPGTAYGASLHHELQLLTRAGLSPVETLFAATAGAADAFNLTERGRMEPGARADLVLIEGDPRRDIAATLSIAHVIRNVLVIESAGEGQASPPPAGAALETADISDFAAPTNGYAWVDTTDAMAGGNSEAVSTVTDGVLRTEIAVRTRFPFPWAGPGYFPASQAGSALNLSDAPVLVLRLRAAPGTYRVMLFNPGLTGAPPTVSTELDESWRTVRLDMTNVDGFDPAEFAGLAVVGGPAPGEAWIEIDQARFEAAP